MDFKEKSKRCLKIIVTAFLAFSMVLTTGMSEVFATNQITPDYNEDIKLSMKWQLDKNKQADNLDIHATNSSSRRITQRITYSGENVSRDYMPGELSIVVKGMKKLYRNQNLKAEQIGADLSSDTNKLRDWSYSYNNASDEYTFTNNHQISKDTTLDGFFDIIYNVDPSSSMHGLKLEGKDALYSMLYYPDGSCNKSNSITLSNQTDKSEYQVNIKQGTTTSDSGLNGYVKDKKQYVLLRYDLSQDVHYVARNLANQEQILTLPDGFIVCNNDVNATKVKDDTNSYKVNLYHRGYVYVACPNTYLGQTVNIKFDLNGMYFEDDKDDPYPIASSNINTTLPHEYTYTTPDGRVYRLDVDTSGNNLISSDIQSSRGQNTSYDVKTTYSYIQDYNAELETVLDHNFITVKDGQYRQMKESEYDITSISTGNTFNDASQQISTGGYEIYACKSSVFKKEGQPIRSGNMSDLKNLFLELPNGTKSVGIIYRDFHEAFSSDIKVNMNIHDVGDDTLFNSGRVIHSAYTRFHTYDEKWSNPKDLTAKTYKDVPGVNEEEIDKTSYGNVPLTRDADDNNITAAYIDRNNYMSTKAHFDNLKEESVNNVTADGQLYASFDFKDDTSQPTDFSLYTILPKGVHLKDVSDVNELFDSVSINGSSTNVSNSYLIQHCTPVMIDNYKNSGRTYFAFKFKLHKGDMNASSSLTVNMKLIVDLENVENSGYSDSLQSYLSYDDSSVPLYKFNLHKDDGRSFGGSIYTNVNRNDSTDDLVATDEDTASFTYASSGLYGIRKYIKGSKDSHYTSDPTFTEIGKEYKYALEISTGTSTLKDITLHEELEKLGDVQGKFKSISFSRGYTGTYDKDNHTITLNEPISEGQKVRAYITLMMPNIPSKVGGHIKNNFTLKATVMSNGVITQRETNLDSNTTEAVVSLPKGTVAVRKLDAKTKEPLSGAKFGIYENEYSVDPIETKVSNANGYANFKNLDYGKNYYVKEIEAPKGYKKVGSGISKTLDKDRVEVEMENQPIPGTIQVTKRSDLDKDAKLKGAKFTLYRMVNGQKKYYSSETTDKQGSITFENLEWGKYVLEETEAPKGYSISSEPQEIVVDANTVVDSKNNPTTIKVDVENKQDDVLVILNKFVKDVNGKETDERLQGAKFKLYKVKDASHYDLSNSKDAKLVGEYYTNALGQIAVDQLGYGDYIFHESVLPLGYESGKNDDSLNKNDYIFHLTPDEKNVDLTVYNKRRAGSIAVIKTDGKNHVVQDAKFTLYDENMNPISKNVSVNEKGIVVFDNLEWGTYFVKESEAPFGYKLDENTYEVTIKGSQLSQRLEIANNQIPVSIQIQKVDSEAKTPLANAQFNLCKNDGSVIAALVTDENGKADYQNLPWGSYYLEETKAPAGYTIDTTKHRFVVNAYTAGKIQRLVIENEISNSKSFKIVKRIKKDDIWKPHGDIVFNYNVSYKDVSGNINYRNISLNFEKYKTIRVNDRDYAEVSAIVDKIPSNVTEVKVYEYGTNRYQIAGVTDKNGASLEAVENSSNQYSSYTLPLTADDGSDLISFKNDKINWKDYSDSGSIVNTVAKKVHLTSITAVNKGKVNPKTKVDLSVIANYDDGTHEELSSNEYKIIKSDGFKKKNGKLYWPNSAGTYIIEVEYCNFKDSITGIISPESVLGDPYLVHEISTILGDKEGQLNITKEQVERIVICTSKAPSNTKVVNAEQIDDDNNLEDLEDGIVAWLEGNILYISTQNPAQKIKLPKDSSNEFSLFETMTSIDGLNLLNTSEVTDMSNLFRECYRLTALDLSTWDTSNVTNMSALFRQCVDIKSLDLNNWNTSHVTNMFETFRGMNLSTLHISNWNTSNVKNMSYMFWYCDQIRNIEISMWDMSRVENIGHMFYGCKNVGRLDVAGWNTSHIRDMEFAFSYCTNLWSLNVQYWDTSEVTDMGGLFAGCQKLSYLNVEHWNTSKVTSIGAMFSGCKTLERLSLENWDTSKVKDMAGIFKNCKALEVADVSHWDTSNVKYIDSMFKSCGALQVIDVSHFNTAKVTKLNDMFLGCNSVSVLDVSHWDTSNVTDMSNMFTGCKKVAVLDVAGFNTSKVTTMASMFSSCIKANVIDVSHFDTSNVTDMSSMFYHTNAKTLDVSNWNTAKVTTLKQMFSGTNIQEFNVSTWDVSNVEDLSSMFEYCKYLTKVVVPDWDTSNVYSIERMFYNCNKLSEIDTSHWNTSKVEYMQQVFYRCENLNVLDLSNWNTSNVTNMYSLFQACTQLTTIYVSNAWNNSRVNNSRYMFSGCAKLVGGSGVEFDWNKNDDSMANYQNGYFTYKRGTSPIKLDYQDGREPELNSTITNSSQLPIPERNGYKFGGWYYAIENRLENSIDSFSNPNGNYPWVKDENDIYSSGNKGQSNTESKMLSAPFTLKNKTMISFEWKSDGELLCDYLGYDIYDVTHKKYLSGITTPTYSQCLENLRGKASSDYTKITRDLDPGTYKILFMYGKDGSGNESQDRGFVKNVCYGETWRPAYIHPVGTNKEIPDGVTLYAKWTKE